jgi:hypothetical protein
MLPLSLTCKIGREGEVIESLVRQVNSSTAFNDFFSLGLIRSKGSDFGSLIGKTPFNSLKPTGSLNKFTFTLYVGQFLIRRYC